MIEALQRVLLARAEFQAVLIATVDAAILFGLFTMEAEQIAGLNLLLVAWFGLASRLAFRRDIEELAQLTQADR